MSSGFSQKLLHSITGADWFIALAAILALAVLTAVLVLTRSIAGLRTASTARADAAYIRRRLYIPTQLCWSLFTTGISLFPLLGMFGTVRALLGLDLSAGDLSNIKGNFFDALTSTAWGLIFSILFKLVYACVVDRVEEQLDCAKALSEDPAPAGAGEDRP